MKMLSLFSSVALVALLALAGPAAAADTLVTRAADGSPAAGVAKSWKITGNTVVLALTPGTPTAPWAALLKERLAGVTVAEGPDQLTITGIPGPALLEQLSALTLGGGAADPLSELAGLGGGVAVADGPEGGGSIRASKPTPMAGGAREIQDHDPKLRFEAEVVEVKRGDFPNVTLKLKMRRGDRSNPLAKKLYYGKVIEAVVVFAAGELTGAVNRRNLAAWYLEPGDRVIVRPTAVSDTRYEVDYLVRTR